MHLQKARVSVHFMSVEPLIAPVGWLCLDNIHWVIIGGESGPGPRANEVRMGPHSDAPKDPRHGPSARRRRRLDPEMSRQAVDLAEKLLLWNVEINRASAGFEKKTTSWSSSSGWRARNAVAPYRPRA